MSAILEVKNLSVNFKSDLGDFPAVDNISFSINEGETLGLVGESGCGKSVTSLAILRLIQKPGYISNGSVLWKGKSLQSLSDSEMRKVRGREISMIFQEPMTALNPVFTIGFQIDEVIALHEPDRSVQSRRDRVLELLNLVGIPSPQSRMEDYPHQLSGGMRQRIMIAMALACRPKLLIADEPTTALDVTIQAQILELLKSLQKEMGMSILLITHDLGVVAETCNRVAVMYAGRIAEEGPVMDIFKATSHPYTRGLLDSIPFFQEQKQKLKTIPGLVPSLNDRKAGCSFADRCFAIQPKCRETVPNLENIFSANHRAACFFPLKGKN